MQLKKCLLTMGFAVGLGLVTSHANATLYGTVSSTTGAIHADSGATNLSCQAANAGSFTITNLVVEMFDKDGVLLRTSGVVTLAPNKTFQLWHLNYTGMAYCRITAAGEIRGNIQTHRWMGTYWKAVNYHAAKWPF